MIIFLFHLLKGSNILVLKQIWPLKTLRLKYYVGVVFLTGKHRSQNGPFAFASVWEVSGRQQTGFSPKFLIFKWRPPALSDPFRDSFRQCHR